jgi:hypothetical protein
MSKGIPVVTDFKKNKTKKVVVFEVDEEIVSAVGLVKKLEYVNVGPKKQGRKSG